LRSIAAGSEQSGGETTRSPNDLRRDLKVKLQDLVTMLHVAEGRETGLAAAIAQMEAKIGELAALEKQFRQLEARQTAARDLERSLSSKVEEARVAMDAGEPSLQVVERASVPMEPEPTTRRIVLVAVVLLGGMLAVGLALALELLDPRVRCREDVADLVDAGGQCAEAGQAGGHVDAEPSVASPAFRAFRRFVNDLCARDRAWPALAIASPHAGDGRSTVARSIGVCLAMRGERITLIDADLRHDAGVRSVTAAGPGYADVLQRGASLDECTQRGAHERLAVVPCSEAVPAADTVLLLDQPEAAHALAAATARDRRVVLDLPPAGEDEGAFELACAAGTIVLVARYGSTRRASLAELVRRLKSRGVHVAGAVVLDVPPERQHPYAGPSALATLRAEAQRLAARLQRKKTHA
jgi:Mrp family chromosome partitioning ATPase